jgi:hypothetical protein
MKLLTLGDVSAVGDGQRSHEVNARAVREPRVSSRNRNRQTRFTANATMQTTLINKYFAPTDLNLIKNNYQYMSIFTNLTKKKKNNYQYTHISEK